MRFCWGCILLPAELHLEKTRFESSAGHSGHFHKGAAMKIEDVEAMAKKVTRAQNLAKRIATLQDAINDCKNRNGRFVMHQYGCTSNVVVSVGAGYDADIQPSASPVFWAGLEMALTSDLAARLRELESI